MKNILLGLILFCAPLLAQEEGFEETIEKPYGLSVGPMISSSLGINSNDTPSGLQNAIDISSIPSFGASFYQPLSAETNLGLIGEVKYSSYPFKIKGYSKGI